MKQLFIVDTDEDFKKQVKSLCPSDQVEVRIFSTGMEIFTLIPKDKPYLVLVSLEVPDVNDFLLYDLLKKAMNNSVIVVVTYSNQTESQLQKYKKMKFQPKEYRQKPIPNDDIYNLLQTHLGLDDDDDDEFSVENIDRLVRGEYLKTDDKYKDDTSDLPLDVPDIFKDRAVRSREEEETGDSELALAGLLDEDEDEEEEYENVSGLADRELRNQVTSLEQQNEFLRSENKELSKAIAELKAEVEKGNERIRRMQSQLNVTAADKDAKLVNIEQKSMQLQAECDSLLNKHDEEKNRFISEIETAKDDKRRLEEENKNLSEQLKAVEKENADMQICCDQLSRQLSDKDRELDTRNLEQEKFLEEKSSIVLKEAEERLTAEFSIKEQRWAGENRELKEEKERNETALKNEIEKLEQLVNQLQSDSGEWKRREESLNRTVSTLAEEKVSASDQLRLIQQEKDALLEKFKSLEEEKGARAEKLKIMAEENTALLEKFKSLEEENAAQAEKLEIMAEENAALLEKFKSLEEEKGVQAEKLEIMAEENTALADRLKPLEEENAAFSEKLEALEGNLHDQRQEMEEKENMHLSALENLKKELEKVLDSLQFYKNRVNDLGGVLQRALELTRIETPGKEE